MFPVEKLRNDEFTHGLPLLLRRFNDVVPEKMNFDVFSICGIN